MQFHRPQAEPAADSELGMPRDRAFRRIYPLRVIGMGLGGLATGSVLLELHPGAATWALWLATSLLWPHLAYLAARFGGDRYRSEQRNLLIDSGIAGMWMPLMHFNLLPCAVIATVTTFDKLGSGIRNLWLRSLPVLFGAAAVGTLLLRPQPRWQSSVVVVLCTLPLLVVHTISSSIGSYRLIRTVSRQNRLLEAMRRTDAQTGLYAREHWMERAEGALRRWLHFGEPACLLMIDIDRFKGINDAYGHGVGDEVIAAVGEIILDCVREQDCAGRYGGDEFAVICANADPARATQVAERIRQRIEATRIPGRPELTITASIGLAELKRDRHDLRAWFDAADGALYHAKRDGRNRLAVAADAVNVDAVAGT